MINARELRIGNWLNWNGSASQIQSGGINLFEEGKLHIEPRPILLTEEWLLRMGFEKSQRRTDWDYKLSISAINLYCRFNKQWYFELEGIYLGSKPKYVHQLQNLYFALTGQELELK